MKHKLEETRLDSWVNAEYTPDPILPKVITPDYYEWVIEDSEPTFTHRYLRDVSYFFYNFLYYFPEALVVLVLL